MSQKSPSEAAAEGLEYRIAPSQGDIPPEHTAEEETGGTEGCTGEVVSRKMLPFLISPRFCREKGTSEPVSTVPVGQGRGRWGSHRLGDVGLPPVRVLQGVVLGVGQAPPVVTGRPVTARYGQCRSLPGRWQPGGGCGTHASQTSLSTEARGLVCKRESGHQQGSGVPGWEGWGGAGRYLLEVDELRDGSHHLDGDLHHVLGRRHGSRGGTGTARQGSPPRCPAVPGRRCHRRRLPAYRRAPPPVPVGGGAQPPHLS